MDFLLNTQIVSAFFRHNLLTVGLNDGRIIIFPCTTLTWLTEATPAQQQNFSIESDGYGIWWDELDDGIAHHHLLHQTTPARHTELISTG